VLVDYEMSGRMVHAVIQPTKRGELFVLDRETGTPLKPVQERSVPQDGMAGENRSRTQPYSTGMPSFSGGDLVESDMWGITPLDQLWCRINFREARYEGQFTPPNLTIAIEKPGKNGGINWGSVAVDVSRHVVIVNSSDLPIRTRLIPRAEADAMKLKPQRANEGIGHFGESIYAQDGTPYAASSPWFLSPLGVPCNQPPHGRVSAVDLVSGKLIWSRPLGDARDIGPWGWRSHLPLLIGTVNLGGSTATQGGVTFIAAALDRTLRAFDTATGKELWQARLPGLAPATPITYMSQDSGRQFIVVSSGAGTGLMSVNDRLTAFALPKNAPH
jgi:quinoprotein glucose dehydrogenase